MASLSDFQRKKLGYIYHVFYDVNNDGKVDWDDFSCALEKIATLNKWEEENPKKKQALECLQLVWDGLKKYADENSDDEISKDEWYKMWSDCADKVVAKQEFPYWLSSYMSFMFDAADTSGDNVIDKEEFRQAYTSFGLSADVCDSAFDKFSDGGKVQLTKDTYSKLWHEFFLSNDVEAKGNFLFGAIE
ncbi:sarcoplasmic calcium-binding proteins I, III, and IV-like [Watersipora subatra]|uniref:sarcoplasmic calcium-binding proteins I, III, and IV-like n=1 Tax=Watersipora subatra TaxID=2589382 RepID=UPI00355B05DB